MARLILSPHVGLATPHSLSVRKRDGLEPAAELRVEVPSGRGSKIVTVDLTADELILLAEKALEGYRVLSKN